MEEGARAFLHGSIMCIICVFLKMWVIAVSTPIHIRALYLYLSKIEDIYLQQMRLEFKENIKK